MTPILLDNAECHVEFLHYPPTGALVRGDPWTVVVDIHTDGQPVDTTGWTWRAQIRRHPDADLLDEFTVTTGHTPDDGTVASEVRLHLDPDHTRRIPNGAVFDLEQLTPEQYTWWISVLRIAPDVSH